METRKKKPDKEKTTFQVKSENEAIKIMLTGKKMSSKINYDVLRTLTGMTTDSLTTTGSEQEKTSKGNDDDTEIEGKLNIKEVGSESLVTIIESGPVVPKRNVKNEKLVKDDPGKDTEPPRKKHKPQPIIPKVKNLVSDVENSEIVEDLVVVEKTGPVIMESDPAQDASEDCLSCRQCGCSEIDSDPARGDAVCTNCGFVLEESLIVSEVTFEEDGHGGASAIGQFVSAESRGGGCMAGGTAAFHSGVGKESRELTLRNAKKKIVEVAQQLRLNQHCIDVAFNFFKMALHKQLTKGRRNALTIAACIYMTCRIEGTPHLLIDFSDVVQMDVYALGRAYIQISRALFINIPAVDPCMYILRFAHKFNLGDKTHEVAMTGLRLVQRMKRDWIHLGRRPSGLCGAALLIAARLHNFSRTVQDIIRVVKVHETTLRKRLIEFGETPSSSLTLEEFMSVDLEEEHDPPSFKAARLRDREQLQRLLDDDVSAEMTDIQKKIEEELQKRKKKIELELEASKSETSLCPRIEAAETTRFIMESTMDVINEIILDTTSPLTPIKETKEIGSEIKANGLKNEPVTNAFKKESVEIIKITADVNADRDRALMPPPSKEPFNIQECGVLAVIPTEVDDDEDIDGTLCSQDDCGDLDMSDLDDAEINSYLMNAVEVERKRVLWEKLNQDYIIAQKRKNEKLEQDIKDGKFDKKKKPKKSVKEKGTFQAKSANEAIKIMLMERKMSSKINYDVLRTLTGMTTDSLTTTGSEQEKTSKGDDDDTEIEGKLNIKGVDSESLVTIIESGPVVPKRNVKKEKLVKDDPDEDTEPPKKRHKPQPIIPKVKNEAMKKKEELDDNVFEDDTSVAHNLVPDVENGEIIEGLDVVEETGPVIMESGPVQYAAEDFDTEDEDEQGTEGTLSARELLTQFRGEAEEGYDDYYD